MTLRQRQRQQQQQQQKKRGAELGAAKRHYGDVGDRKRRGEMEEEEEEKGQLESSDTWCRLHFGCVLLLAAATGYFAYSMNSRMWENHVHFSHLATIEREMLLSSELGFYYSFYKQVIEAPSLISGVQMLLRDKLSEYPDTINALHRFNLYPELAIGAAYRAYSWLRGAKGVSMECYRVNRGNNMPPVESCEGIGEPMYFYIEIVYILSGVMASCFVLLAANAGQGGRRSLLAGCVAAAGLMFNHRECTRVQWTPSLRESFSYPLLVLHQLCLVIYLRSGTIAIWRLMLVVFSAVLFMLPWQFAQFALLVEACALLGSHMLGFISRRCTHLAVLALLCALAIAFCLQFGNVMLVASYYCSALLTILVLLPLFSILNRLLPLFASVGASLFCLLCGTILCKLCIGWLLAGDQDSHIWDILRSKFSAHITFDSMIYTCAKEFDFYDTQSLFELTYTLALPMGAAAVLIVCCKVARLIAAGRGGAGVDAVTVYLTCLFFGFSLMAALIMRLKLFFTPQLILMASLLGHAGVLPLPSNWRRTLVFALLCGSAYKGLANYNNELGISGEYSDWSTEQLMYFVQQRTPQNASFTGLMTVTSTIRLVAKRPIVNHPHYEDARMRAKTKEIYSMYSHVTLRDWTAVARRLSVNYVLVMKGYCRRGHCSMPDIFERTESQPSNSPVLCEYMLQHSAELKPYMQLVFENDKYLVFRVL